MNRALSRTRENFFAVRTEGLYRDRLPGMFGLGAVSSGSLDAVNGAPAVGACPWMGLPSTITTQDERNALIAPAQSSEGCPGASCV